MRTFHRLTLAVLALALPAFGQNPPPIDRLPQDTVFFFAWSGAAAIEKGRATNSLLRLWDDPDFAAARQVFLDRALRDSKSKDPARDKAVMQTILEAGANPFVLGMIGAPDLKSFSSPRSPDGKRKPSGFFFIYDRTGKADQLQRLLALRAEEAKGAPVTSTHSFSGVTVTKQQHDGNADFGATVENYFVSTDSQEVIEKLITRLKGPAPADSIVALQAYQSAAAQRTPDAFFEFFARIPDLTRMDLPPAQGMNFAAMMKGLHLERIHAIAASASLAGNGARMRGAVLGDTAPGSAFDLFAAGNGEFRTLAVAPAGASYSAAKLDLLALYRTLRNALRAGLNPEQISQFEMMEGMVGAQLGMDIGEALQVISGEVATIQLDSDGNGSGSSESLSLLDPLRNMYAMAIDRPDDALKLVRLALGNSLTSESVEAGSTILAFTSSYRDEKTGAQRKRFNYMGVTSNLIIIAPRKALLREAMARASAQQGPASSGLANDAAFLQMRSRLPHHLTALSYSDFARTPWHLIVNAVLKDAANQKEGQKLTPQEEEALRNLSKLLPRYLHSAFGGYWKDRNGIFMESYIE